MSARRGLLRFAAWMVFGPVLVQSVKVATVWWNTPQAVEGWELAWVYALPVLVLVFLRYFSRLGCDSGCTLPDSQSRHIGPGP